MIDITAGLLTLNDNHKIALNEALAWVSVNFKPVGIIVTGSIVRGNNNFNHVYSYFQREFENNRPVSAHMISTGKLIMGNDHPGIKN
jgi:hypothetical protein